MAKRSHNWVLLLLRVLSGIGLMIWAPLGCGLPEPPTATEDENETYDWRAEIAQIYAEQDRAAGESPPVETEEGLYSTLVIMNSTANSRIIRCTEIGSSTGKDLLQGRTLNPGQYMVISFDGQLPRSVKIYWSDGTSTAHSVPQNGRLTLTDANSGYQGTNVYVVG